MADSTRYVIRGGLEGREQLRVLARVMRESSTSLFDRLSEVARQLYEFASNPDTVAGMPRVAQAWGRRPAQ